MERMVHYDSDVPESDHAVSPTKSAQDVLRRMSLNSPPSRTDNPRHVKRAKLLAGTTVGLGNRGSDHKGSRGFAAPPSQTPRKIMSRINLAAPSPMASWGPGAVNLRDASAGEVLEATEPSALFPPFELDCLRPPPGSTSSASTTMDDEDGSAESSDPSSPVMTTPTSVRDSTAGDRGTDAPRGGRMNMSAAFDEVAADRSGVGGSRSVLDTPRRRPGSGARATRSAGGVSGGGRARGRVDDSCSPVSASRSFAVQGSPVKKRSSVGRWRLSVDCGSVEDSRHASPRSPPGSARRSSAPASCGSRYGRRQRRTGQDDSEAMPAPAPRSSLSSSATANGDPENSPMDTGEAVDFGAVAAGTGRGKGDDGSFLRRVSTGSYASLFDSGDGRGKTPDDAPKPSPCDVTAFVPVTPYREGMPGVMHDGGDDVAMSPLAGRSDGVFGTGGRKDRSETRGRFATDFEELEVIGSGSFGTVYKVRSRLDGCLYAVKATRRRFRGEADRRNMLREVYALAEVCNAQDTSNIVRYHQAWIEDERLYIQTELCETSLEKQLESGMHLEITGVYAFLRQILLGLDILHRHHLVHLDIKPGNIFVKNGQYKLGDFGLVTPVHVRSDTDVVEGDSRYMSKELLSDDHSNLTKCDVFSLGITLYEIISGRPLPPNGEEWHRLRSGKIRMPMGLPAELSQTLNAMMHPEASQRPSAAELLRYPCLQSEMERQLHDQASKLEKERTHNEALKLEVSALIQKQSQRTGRLSRTITWDHSYFTKSSPGCLFSQHESPAASARAGTPASKPSASSICRVGGSPPLTSRAKHGCSSIAFAPDVSFGAGTSTPSFGGATGAAGSRRRGNTGKDLSTLPEREEALSWSPAEARPGTAAGVGASSGRPASFSGFPNL